MAKPHYCPGLSWLVTYRETMTKDVDAGKLHKELRNRRFQHAVHFLHTLFYVLGIVEDLNSDSPRLQFRNNATRGDPVQKINDYLKKLDQTCFQKLYDGAASKLSEQQQAQFQTSIRVLLSWTREQGITPLGSELLPAKLTGRIAYDAVPVDVIDRLPVLRDYIAHLGRKLESKATSRAVLRVSREAARNFVIEILKKLDAKVGDSKYAIGGKVHSPEQFCTVIAKKFRTLGKDNALELIAAMGQDKDKQAHQAAAHRVRQFITWANESEFVSFSGEDILQSGRRPRLATVRDNTDKKPRTPRPKKAKAIRVKKAASPKKTADSKPKSKAKQKKPPVAAPKKATMQEEKRRAAAAKREEKRRAAAAKREEKQRAAAAKREEKRRAAAAKREAELKRKQAKLERQKERDQRRREREAERNREREERRKAQEKKAQEKADKEAAKAAAVLAKQQAEQTALKAEAEKQRRAKEALKAKRDAENRRKLDQQTLEQRIISGLEHAVNALPTQDELEDKLPGSASIDLRNLPFKYMAWRDLHINNRKRAALNFLMVYVFDCWLNSQQFKFNSQAEHQADNIAENKMYSLDLRKEALLKRKLTSTLTFQLCFNGAVFTKQCEELVKDLELGDFQIEAILNHCIYWIVANGFGGK